MTSDKGVYFLPAMGDTWIDISNDLLVGNIDQLQLGANNVWVRARNGGVWKQPRYGDVGLTEQAAPGASPHTLWPNPASDVLQVSAPEVRTGELEVIDATGRRVLRAPLRGGTVSLDVSGLAPGSYQCVLRSETGSRSSWFMRP